MVANRVALELGNIHPRPPAVRVFDAGVGDGTVLTRVMRAMHDRFPHMPFYVVGKEISLEDVRLALQKMADRFFEHPATVLVLTNLAYADAPWLHVKSLSAASSLVWHEVRADRQHRARVRAADHRPRAVPRRELEGRRQPKTGNPVYERPVVLVIYRDDHKFLLDPIIPQPGRHRRRTTISSSPRSPTARAPPLEFKAQARDRAARPRARPGRPADRHPFARPRSRHGDHPARSGRATIRSSTDRHQILKAVKHELGPAGARPQLQRLCR